jgi:hypothetical protein
MCHCGSYLILGGSCVVMWYTLRMFTLSTLSTVKGAVMKVGFVSNLYVGLCIEKV